ncbi:hypothetical protein [Methanobrevibacter sp. DSM 116169]|uniref:hypothetical protein n=1 Tax=Methanobrevibacter sp. DSM 116169 TaxID=3242727 RepID=UPI0038FCED98
MKIKNIVVLLILLFLSISAVSANDMIGENNVEITNNDEINNEFKNFTWLDESIGKTPNKGVLDLNGSTIINVEDTFNNGIHVLYNDITIKNGIIDANNKSSIFWVGEVNLVLDNITLKNGQSENNGGAIFNSGGTITIINSTFVNNYAIFGAAIMNSQGEINIINGFFYNNFAEKNGGAISNAFGNLSILNGEFSDNYAGWHGALFNNELGFITVEGGIFKNNKGNGSGAVIFNDGSSLIMNNAMFINNTAYEFFSIIYNYAHSNLTINNGIFVNNTAEMGALFVNTESNLIINNASFKDNIASIIRNERDNYIGSGDTAAKINGGIFDNNSPNYGDIIYNSINSEMVISNAKFINNIVLEDYGDYSYIIDNKGNMSILGIYVNSSLKNHIIYNDEEGNLFLENNTLINDIFNEKILNHGFITSGITLTIIGNDTIYLNSGDTINLTANLTDDMNNIIVGNNVILNNDILGDIYLNVYENGLYYNLYRIVDEGLFPLTGVYEGGNISYIFGGILDVNGSNLFVDDLVKYYGNDSQLVAYLFDDEDNPLEGMNLTFFINGRNYTRTTDSFGCASMNINLDPGDYEVLTVFYGLGNYPYDSFKSSIKILPTIDGDDLYKFFKEDYQYYADLIDFNGNVLANTNVTMNINGVMYIRETNENGTVKLNINLDPGTYIITVYNPINNDAFSNKIVVWNTIYGENITKLFRNDTQYEAQLITSDFWELANTNVTMNINGVMYIRETNEQGIVKLNINLDPGTYIITISNPSNGEVSSNVIVVLPILDAEDIIMDATIRKQFEVKAIDDVGEPAIGINVTININGVLYNRTTDDNGIARLNINLSPGTYIATSFWKDCYISNTVTVVNNIYDINNNTSSQQKISQSDAKAIAMQFISNHILEPGCYAGTPLLDGNYFVSIYDEEGMVVDSIIIDSFTGHTSRG